MLNCEVLVVAAAGGGGHRVGGGGAAGGYETDTDMDLAVGVYDVTVGDGGEGATSAGAAENGEDSVFNTITSKGGGFGGSWGEDGGDGASGGGAPSYIGNPGEAVADQGNDGGTGGGYIPGATVHEGAGGGGASDGVGEDFVEDGGIYYAGSGGPGKLNAISGTPKRYAAGGGAGAGIDTTRGNGGSSIGGNGGYNNVSYVDGGDGDDNTGAGAGGGGYYVFASTSGDGGKGGSGIVIIRYVTGGYKVIGGTITTNEGTEQTETKTTTLHALNGWLFVNTINGTTMTGSEIGTMWDGIFGAPVTAMQYWNPTTQAYVTTNVDTHTFSAGDGYWIQSNKSGSYQIPCTQYLGGSFSLVTGDNEIGLPVGVSYTLGEIKDEIGAIATNAQIYDVYYGSGWQSNDAWNTQDSCYGIKITMSEDYTWTPKKLVAPHETIHTFTESGTLQVINSNLLFTI